MERFGTILRLTWSVLERLECSCGQSVVSVEVDLERFGPFWRSTWSVFEVDLQRFGAFALELCSAF